jgi:predicted nucleotidyltransferase
MREQVAKVVDPFLAEADRALGQGYAAVLYGSAARGDWLDGRSDVNLLLVARALPAATLRALGPAFAAWRKASPEPPLLLTDEEWRAADDTFPLEITDMRTAYRVLRGADPLGEVRVAPADLRRALEREARGKLLRLRQGYAVLSGDPAALGHVAAESVSTVLLLGRALLVLVGREPPADPVALADAVAALAGFPSEALADVVRHRRERGRRLSGERFEAYLDALERLTRYLDQLHPGDVR